MKRKIAIAACAAAVLVIAAGLLYIFMRPAGLELQQQTEHFNVYCTKDDTQSAEAAAEILEGNYGKITSDLGAEPSEKCRLMVYPDIDAFHKAVGSPDAPDWFVGTADGYELHLVSPSNPGSTHSYGDIMFVAVHEFTHIVINEINSDIPVYLNEGVATYEAGQSSGVMSMIQQALINDTFPTLEELSSLSPNDGLYQFGYALVDYITDTYGFSKVTEFIRNPSVEEVFGMSSDDFSRAWRQSYNI